MRPVMSQQRLWISTLFIMAAVSSALPSDSKRSLKPHLLLPSLDLPDFNRNSNITSLKEYKEVDCFNDTTPLAFSLDIDDCDHAIDLLYHDPTGVMNVQTFSYHAVRCLFIIPFPFPCKGPRTEDRSLGSWRFWHAGRLA